MSSGIVFSPTTDKIANFRDGKVYAAKGLKRPALAQVDDDDATESTASSNAEEAEELQA